MESVSCPSEALARLNKHFYHREHGNAISLRVELHKAEHVFCNRLYTAHAQTTPTNIFEQLRKTVKSQTQMKFKHRDY